MQPLCKDLQGVTTRSYQALTWETTNQCAKRRISYCRLASGAINGELRLKFAKWYLGTQSEGGKDSKTAQSPFCSGLQHIVPYKPFSRLVTWEQSFVVLEPEPYADHLWQYR